MDKDTALMVGNPTQIVADAQVGAQALTNIIRQKPKKVIINGEQYIEFEDWQTVGQFFGVGVSTGQAEPIQLGDVNGFKATAELIHQATGTTIGGAEAYCMRDEAKWQNKPTYQLASMAQTRAGAKALRNRFAWVVVLAGFKTTPAEEMPDSSDEAPKVPTEHFCKLHNTKFFKSGRMKDYAHKLEDGTWCNESEQKPSSEGTTTPTEASIPVVEGIDMDWLQKSVESLQWGDFLNWLKKTYSKDGVRSSDIIAKMNEMEKAHLAQEVNKRLAEQKEAESQ